MSQTQGLIQEPQFLRSQVVAQQSMHSKQSITAKALVSLLLSNIMTSSFFSSPRSYSYFTYSYFK